MFLDGIDFLVGEHGIARANHAGERAESAVALVPPGATGDLRHFRGGQPALAHPVELGEPGEGDMADIEVEPHADRVGGNDIVDLARLVERDLGIAGLRAQRPHHHRRAAAEAPQHLGNRIDLLGREGDDGAARAGCARAFARRHGCSVEKRGRLTISASGTRALHHRFQRCRTQDHRLLAAARVEQPVGENVAALAVGGQAAPRQARQRQGRPTSAWPRRCTAASARPWARSAPRR